MFSQSRFVLLLVLAPLISSMSTQEQGLTIGIVLADGILIPVASHNEGRWTNPWPPYGRGDESLIKDLGSIPQSWLPGDRSLKRSWHLESFDGKSGPLKIHAPAESTRAGKQCGDYLWGLATDVSPIPVECSYCCPFQKIGYAFDQKLSIRRFNPVSEPTDAIMRLISPEFNRQEVEAVERVLPSPGATSSRRRGFPLEQETRAGMPIKIEVLTFSAGKSSEGWFYYRASREYPKPDDAPDPICPWISVSSGWIKGTDAGGVHLAKGVSLTDCDRKGTESISPFATFDFDGETYAVGQRNGWEYEEIVILKMGSSVRAVISTPLHGL